MSPWAQNIRSARGGMADGGRPMGPQSLVPDHQPSLRSSPPGAPRHVGKGLRLSRLGGFDAALGALRAAAGAAAASKAGDHDRTAWHKELAASCRALRDHCQQ